MKWLYKFLGIVPEAPKDGRSYVRKKGEWVEVDTFATDSEVSESLDKILKV